MSATYRFDRKLRWFLFVVTLVMFPIGVVIFLFSSCDVRKRSEKRACRAGELQPCLDVGKYYEDKADGIIGFLMSNADTAITHYHRACALKSAVGCERMMYLLDHGEQAKNLSLELTDVADALITSCAANVTGTCDQLWGFMDREWAANRAANALAPHCTAGEARACYLLARMHVEGMGGLHKTLEEVLPLYEQACAGGIADGCSGAKIWRDEQARRAAKPAQP